MLTQEEIQDALDDCNTFLETAIRINKIKNEKMKITEETRIKDILPEGYEVVKTHQNIESIVIEMKRKRKDFGQYAMGYQDDAVSVTLSKYLRERDVDAWPWEFRIGLFRYICEDLNVDPIAVLYGLQMSFDYNYDKCKSVFIICPEEFLKSLI